MAGSTHGRARPGFIVVAAAGLVGLLADSALAAPDLPSPGSQPATRSVADVQREVAGLGRQLEVVTEQYNGATIALGRARAAQKAAQAKARTLAAALHSAAKESRTIVSATYRSSPLNPFTAMMVSTSPRDYLERLSALDVLSDRRTAAIDTLKKAKARADAADSAAAQATQRAQKLAADLKAKKAWIEQRLPQMQALLDGLTAQQRQQALGPDTRASRGATRTTPVVQASGKAKIAVEAALSKLGAPYVWAAAGPDAFDCSGLTMWAWAQAGVQLPHYTGDQIRAGTPVDRSQLQPGDLVFYYEDISHVGMYIGDGKIVHAPQPGDVVKIANVDDFPFAGATRVG